MNLTVSAIAKLAQVSVRTLHHYDEIGLLTPSSIGENGYRYYERDALFRLQQILFYRDIGMPLAEIKRTLDDPAFDPVTALKGHRERLKKQVDRHHQLIRTIEETLLELRGEMIMENPFKGFNPEKQQAYERELEEKYGEHAKQGIAESQKRVAKMSKADIEATKEEGHQINLELVVQIDLESAIDSAAVQSLIARHHKWVSHFWVPSREAYIGLGQNYVDHPDFKAFYDKYDVRLVTFLADAMAVYAKANLE